MSETPEKALQKKLAPCGPRTKPANCSLFARFENPQAHPVKPSATMKNSVAHLGLLRAGSLTAILAAQAALATDITWNGADGGNVLWSDVDNWAGPPALPPGTGDTAIFDNAGAADDVIDLTGGLTISRIEFKTAAAEAYTIGTGGANSQSFTVDDGGAITMDSLVAADQLINASVTGSGGLTLGNDSPANKLTAAGTLDAGSLAKTGAGLVVLGGTSTVAGATTVTGGILQYGAGGSTDSLELNGGDITIDDGNTLTATTGNFTFSSSGSILKSGTTGIIASPGAYNFTVAASQTATINASATSTQSVGENDIGWDILVGTGGILNLNGNYQGLTTNGGQKGLILFNGGGTTNVNGLLTNFYEGGSAQTDKLRIGNTSANNVVNVNGTGSLRSNTITLGEGTFGGNSLVATPTVTGDATNPTIQGKGSNISWVIGGASSDNSITLNAGAYMHSSRGNGTNSVVIGRDSGASNNSITVDGAGAFWQSSNVNKFGLNGDHSSLTLSNGGQAANPHFPALRSGPTSGSGAPSKKQTPSSQHHPYAYTIWMAGGGVKPGLTHGESDEIGFNAVKDKVHVHDLQATLLHLLGLDHEKLTFKFQGRHYRLTDVHGHVVKPILA
jgi:autotransporter-associated beta strand protein